MKKKLILMTFALMAISLLAGCGNKHVHNWGEVVYEWSADHTSCTATRVCKDDESHKETETKDSVYAVTKEAKCEEDGTGRYTVTFDNEGLGVAHFDITLEAIGHDYQFVEFVWTETPGNYTAQAKYVCSHDASHIEMHDALIDVEQTTAPTCENTGLLTYTATYETHSDTKTEVLEAKGHSWGNPTYVWNEDHTECVATSVCSNDASHVLTENGIIEVTPIVPATCEASGTAKFTATFTNEEFETQEVEGTVEALGHDYQFVEFVWEGFFAAKAKFVCSHDESHVELHDAQVADSLVNPATCEEEGLRTWTATYGDHSETKEQTIEALGHTMAHVEAKQAKCEEDGNIEHWHCTVCEKNYSDSEGKNELSDVSIPATGHTLGTATYLWSDDHTTCTAKATCSVCNKEVVETVNTAEGELESTDCYLYGLVASFKTKGFEPQIYDYYKFTLNDDKASYSIVKGNHLPSNVVVPNEINKMPVTKIGYEGFYSTDITSIVVSKNIVVIDRYGISYSHELISIDFEEGSKLERIESSGLIANYSLKSINNLPASLTFIGSLDYNDECTSITYLGTMEQWRAIEKKANWNECTPACGAIHCSDGDVDDHWVDDDPFPDDDDDW